MTTRVRVLHLICGLAGGGSERWLRDIVRFSCDTVEHQVVPVYPDGLVDFVYADDLRALTAYDRPRSLPGSVPRSLVRRLRSLSAHETGLVRSVGRGVTWLPALFSTMQVISQFRPAVIHSHTMPDFLMSLTASVLFRIPLVHTVPCLFSQMRAAGYGWMPTVYARAHPLVARFSTGEGRAELEAAGVPAHKILYDLGGVDLESVDAALGARQAHALAVRRELNVPETCPLALTVGRLDRSKGHALGLESMPALVAKVPDVHWVVLGEGEERRRLESRAQELGIGDRVHLLGFVPDPRPYQAAADVYLHTALFEPENFSYYEAMAMGLPVVGFDTGERPDLLRTVGHGVQVARADVGGFAVAVATLLERPDRGRSLGARGAVYAREHLDVRRSVARLAQVYGELSRGHDRQSVG